MTAMLGELRQGNPTKAFEEAVAAGILSTDTTTGNYVGQMMYMGTHAEAGHGFKHKLTRAYLWGPAVKPAKGHALLHLVAARERQDDVVKSLQEALKVANAVSSIAIMPLIADAAELRLYIAALASAFEQDAKDEFERSTVPS